MGGSSGMQDMLNDILRCTMFVQKPVGLKWELKPKSNL